MRSFTFILATVASLILSSRVTAQPLADQVPAGALFYVGWSGSEAADSAYEGSRLKAVLDSTDARTLMTETLPALAQRIGQEDPDAGQAFQVASTIASKMWRHPSAYYFAGLDHTNPRRPIPKMALLCDAGEDSPALIKEIQTAIDRAGKPAVPIKVAPQGKLVVVTIGPEQAGVAGQANLAADARFKAALAKVHAAPVAAAYVNIEAVVKLIDDLPQKAGRRGQQDKEKWTKVRDALGLQSAKVAIWTGAFDGRDWATKLFLAAPSPRSGIFALCDGAPITNDLLQRIPSTATMVAAGTFDPAKLVADLRAAAGKIDPQAPGKIDQGLGQFRAMTSLDLQKDVLEPLGPQWAGYADPHVGGNYSFTGVLMNKLDDPAKAEASFKQLGQSISNLASGMMAQSKMQLNVRELKQGDLTIHYFATPLIRPAWAIKDGVLYAGLFPQLVSSAGAHHTGGKSILENESFTALRKRLAGGAEGKVTGLRYMDLPRTAGAMYPSWLFLTGYAGMGDLFGVQTPAMLLPPLDDLLKQLAPAASVTWMDDAGWYASGVTPFPGAQLIGGDPTLNVGGGALMVSILLPSLNRARETANRVKCASNMRQIGIAILLYSNDNKGKYPPDLGTLLKTQDITAEVFTCPSSYNDVPDEIKAAPIDQQAQWVNENASYIYVGQGKNNRAGAEEVILYEKAGNHDEDGMNFLFGDGHVEWIMMERAQELINQAAQPAPAVVQ